MPSDRRVYFDQAATSWPKSSAAVEAAEIFVRECGATAGRGAYSSARVAERWVADGRQWTAKLIGSQAADSIAFCSSGTHALNAALFGLIRQGQRVITTAIEHNSVLRPLYQLQRSCGIQLEILPCDLHGWIDPQCIASALRDENDVLVVGHASNVTGSVLDITAMGRIARQCGAMFIVDASQTLGYIPIDIEQAGVGCLAAAAHKGLRALPGTGILFVRQEWQHKLQPMMWGGTGVASESVDALPRWPMSVEVGNLNLPGIVSIAVAAKQICDDSAGNWHSKWLESFRTLVEGLQQLKSLRVFAPRLDRSHIPVVSITATQWDSHDLAAALDSSFQVEVRAGLHCAAFIHRHLGTLDGGGTVRISIGHEANLEQIQYLLACLRDLTSS